MNTRTLSANLANELKAKIETRQAQVAVIGLGYVGLPLVLLDSEEKFHVTGFDVDQKKIDPLMSGGSYIFRIETADKQAALTAGFTATADYSRLRDMDAIIIC